MHADISLPSVIRDAVPSLALPTKSQIVIYNQFSGSTRPEFLRVWLPYSKIGNGVADVERWEFGTPAAFKVASYGLRMYRTLHQVPFCCRCLLNFARVRIDGVYCQSSVHIRPALLPSFHRLLTMASATLTPEQIVYQLAHAHETRQDVVYGVCSLYVAVDTIAVGLRVYARRISKNKLLWDDYLIFFALVSTQFRMERLRDQC
jgi:hypothetical protein